MIDGLYDGFARGGEPTTVALARIAGEGVPLSRLAAEQVKALRQWAQGRARPAMSAAGDERQGRKLAA